MKWQEIKQKIVKQLHTYHKVNVGKYQVILCPVYSYIYVCIWSMMLFLLMYLKNIGTPALWKKGSH